MKQPRKALVKTGAVALLLLLIWVFPMTMKTGYLRFFVSSLPEETAAAFTVYSDKAVKPSHTIASTVQDGAVLVKLDREYLAVDRVEIADASVAQAIDGFALCGSAVGLADYTAASLDTDIVVQDADGAFTLSSAALETIQNGLRNPWMMRLLLTAALMLIIVTVAAALLLKKRFGTVATLTVFGIVVGCAWMLLLANMQGLLDKTIPFGARTVPNWVPLSLLTAAMAVLCVLCLLVKDNGKTGRVLIVSIYVAALLLSVGKMAFYTERVANTPDEPAHVGYVAYLTKTGEWIPRFENIELAVLLKEDDRTMHMTFAPDTMSYLKHPPTYYHILRLANAVQFHDDGTFTVQIERLRIFSMVFVVAAMLLLFYLGFTRLQKQPVVHLLYATVCTMVPMLTYTSAGVNNDSFSLLTVAIFFFGIVRYLENKKTVSTYLLITVGITLSVITKVTAGIVVALTALMVLTVSLVRQRSARELLKPAFLWSLLVLAVPAAYFGYVFLKYGGIQPNMFSLNPEYARTTGFYVAASERVSYSFVQYVLYFLRKFMETWTGIASHVSLLKTETSWLSLQNAALVLIWCFPLLFTKRSLRNKTPYSLGVLAGFAGVAAAVVMQLFNGFNVFTSRGYLGGFQSRYYLCAVMFFAFAGALVVEKVLDSLERDDALAYRVRDVVKAATVLYVGLVFYEDILYFLMHYNQYV